jgi:hypothetical protein
VRTTVNIDPELLAEVLEDTGEKDQGRALNKVMAEHIRRKKIKKLLALRGKLNLRDRNEWHELDLQLELEHRKQL